MDVTLRAVALVALGGAIGAPARFLITIAVTSRLPPTDFPFGTLVVNVLGSFILALITWIAVDRFGLTPDARLLFGTGILGALTTYSTFSVETVRLIESDRRELALLYIVLTALLALFAAVLGARIARLV